MRGAWLSFSHSMSYLVLARKWRPQTFEEVVGQHAVVKTLQNAIDRNRVPHAMIFSGVRGVGKTTLARLVAKALNCQEGPTRIPCNKCDDCREITGGSAIDIHEIDGASNRGIQEIRELKENIRFFPTKSRYKIIIIDEVHMLTTEAFNALLKTLEEPPEHVFFMFATTELHKIPITILSRCQRYELQKVTARELAAFFRKIADQEKTEISDWAINVIVREAGGSVRDGLSLLDQIFSFGGEQIADEDVTQVLGLVDSRLLSALAGAVLTGSLSESLKILDDASSYGVDLKRLVNDLLYYFRALIICRISREPEKLVDLADQELDEMKTLAGQHSVETLQLYFNLLLKGAEEMRYSSHPRLMLEMALIKAAEADMVVPVAEILERLEGFQGGRQAKADSRLQPQTAGSEPVRQEVKKAAPEPPKPVAPTVQEKKVKEDAEPLPIAEDVRQSVKKTTAKTAPPEHPKETKEQESVPPLQPPTKDVRKHWDEFIDYVMERKRWMANTLRICSAVREEDHNLVLKFDDPSEYKMLKMPENIKFLTEFSQDFFQKEFKIVMRARGGDSEDVNGQESNGPQEDRRALANDPLVQMATEVLGGRVVNIRTGPRSR